MADEIKKPQNRILSGQIGEMLRQREESSVTSRYDEAYQEEQALTENRILAEEMLNLSPEAVREENWYYGPGEVVFI